MSEHGPNPNLEEEPHAPLLGKFINKFFAIGLLLLIPLGYLVWTLAPLGELFQGEEPIPFEELSQEEQLELAKKNASDIYKEVLEAWRETSVSSVPICPVYGCAVFLAQENDLNQHCLPFRTQFKCSSVGDFSTRGVVAADFQQDGDADAVYFGPSAHFCRNENDSFDCAPLGGNTRAVAAAEIADIDSDGDLDVVLAIDGPNEVCENVEGIFNCFAIEQEGLNTRALSLGHLNDDSHLDVVFSNEQPMQVCINVNSKPIEFDCNAQPGSTKNTYDVALGDYDGDTNLDALFLGYRVPIFCKSNLAFLDECKVEFGGDVRVNFLSGVAALLYDIPDEYFSNRIAGFSLVSSADFNRDGRIEFILSGSMYLSRMCFDEPELPEEEDRWAAAYEALFKNYFGSCYLLGDSKPPLASDLEIFDVDEDGKLDIIFSIDEPEIGNLPRDSRNAICFNRSLNILNNDVMFECFPFNDDEANTTGIAIVRLNK